MYEPTLAKAREYALTGRYKKIPVTKEIFSDFITPISALRILLGKSNHCFLLESASDSAGTGRYTFLGSNPTLEVTCKDGVVRIKDRFNTKSVQANPEEFIREILSENAAPTIPGMPSFAGGLVGYFSYDYLKYAEPSLNLKAVDSENFNDLDLMLFENVICFDNFRQRIILVTNADITDLDNSYPQACGRLENLAALLRHGEPQKIKSGKLLSPIKPLFDEKQYCEKVERVKDYIKEGDIFQLVLSNQLEANFAGSLLDTYRCLRAGNPSPYMFYFCGDAMELAGSSPETLVKLEDGVLHTYPLAGTRPRGMTSEEDKLLEHELLNDEKELAEHNMLVDLGRNDLGKISQFGTVEVEQYLKILRFSRVMHIGSTVKGKIACGKDALDAVSSVLPAGTLSGAPKLRAMEIIDELEKDKRGIYGGAVGYIGFNGNMDTCIAIRLAYLRNGKVFIRSGAGIVADSEPKKEYLECINKAKAVIEALEKAQKEGEL